VKTYASVGLAYNDVCGAAVRGEGDDWTVYCEDAMLVGSS
jgi:hypothetical protein